MKRFLATCLIAGAIISPAANAESPHYAAHLHATSNEQVWRSPQTFDLGWSIAVRVQANHARLPLLPISGCQVYWVGQALAARLTVCDDGRQPLVLHYAALGTPRTFTFRYWVAARESPLAMRPLIVGGTR